MFLALTEMRRSIVRFLMLVVAVALLVFLVLFQTSIRNGLVTTFIGGISNQTAPVLVLGTDAIRDLSASAITDDSQARILDAAGEAAAASGRIGLRPVPATVGSESTAVAVFGYEDAALGAPSSVLRGRLPERAGEAVAPADTDVEGLAIGDRVTVLPGGYELTIVGQSRDIELGLPTLFTTFESFEAAVRSANPDAASVPANAIALAPASGVTVDELTKRVNAAGDDLDALSRDALAEATPGVAAVTTSFLLIFIIFAIVAPLVTGLFFLIVTFQKARSLTLLRAIGVRSDVLVRSLIAQVAVVMVAGVGLGVALYAPLTNQRLGTIAIRFEPVSVLLWAALFISLGLISAFTAGRRVTAIDPIEATTGAGGSL